MMRDETLTKLYLRRENKKILIVLAIAMNIQMEVHSHGKVSSCQLEVCVYFYTRMNNLVWSEDCSGI